MVPTPQQIALLDEVMHINTSMFNNEEKQEFIAFQHSLREIFAISDQAATETLWRKASDYYIRYRDFQREAATYAASIRKASK